MTARSYGQLCGVARALDVLGHRWTLLVVRNLLVGPMRYTELLETLPGITTNLLAERLKQLEQHGVILKTGKRPYAEYRLTERGEALRPIVLGLGEWGFSCPVPDNAVGNLRWALLSLTRTRRPKFEDCARLQDSGGREFTLCANNHELSITGSPKAPVSVTLEGSAGAFLDLFFGRETAEKLTRSGALSVSGTARAKSRWLRLLAAS